MTEQKKKAKELIDKFGNPIDGLHKYPMCFDTAKQCAILCVDEIISELKNLQSNSWVTDTSEWEVIKRIEFWQQVKQEIINYKN